MKKVYKQVDITELKPYPNNPRINDAAVDIVAGSIEQCGYIAPIIVDEDMQILAGHTRLKALQSLGREKADVVICEGLTDEQKRKYRLLDNKAPEESAWDFDLLETELEGLDFQDLNISWNVQKRKTNDITTGTEIDVEEFQDDEFECECPRCGFKFNKYDA